MDNEARKPDMVELSYFPSAIEWRHEYGRFLVVQPYALFKSVLSSYVPLIYCQLYHTASKSQSKDNLPFKWSIPFTTFVFLFERGGVIFIRDNCGKV